MRKTNSIWKVCVFFILGCCIFVGCNTSEIKPCKYEVKQDGTWADVPLEEYEDLQKIVNKEYVQVQGEEQQIAGYTMSLCTYYYDSKSGNAVLAIKIQKDGLALTDSEFCKIEDDLRNCNFTVRIEDDVSTSNYVGKLARNEKGETFFYKAALISTIEKEESSGDNSEKLERLLVTWREEQIYLQLPDYNANSKSQNIDVSNIPSLVSIVYGYNYVSVIWDTTSIVKEFEQKIEEIKKETKDSFNEEDYGYDVYQNVEIQTKEGEVIAIDKKKTGIVIEVCYEESEEKNMANLRILLGNEVCMKDAEAIIIDGERIML